MIVSQEQINDGDLQMGTESNTRGYSEEDLMRLSWNRKITSQKGNQAVTKFDSTWLIETLQVLTEKMVDTAKRKNADYTGDSSQPFANFTGVESLGICSAEQGFLTRMTDKLSRISSLVKTKGAQVKDESIEDTLLDLANYSLLMLAYLRSKR